MFSGMIRNTCCKCSYYLIFITCSPDCSAYLYSRAWRKEHRQYGVHLCCEDSRNPRWQGLCWSVTAADRGHRLMNCLHGHAAWLTKPQPPSCFFFPSQKQVSFTARFQLRRHLTVGTEGRGFESPISFTHDLAEVRGTRLLVISLCIIGRPAGWLICCLWHPGQKGHCRGMYLTAGLLWAPRRGAHRGRRRRGCRRCTACEQNKEMSIQQCCTISGRGNAPSDVSQLSYLKTKRDTT